MTSRSPWSVAGRLTGRDRGAQDEGVTHCRRTSARAGANWPADSRRRRRRPQPGPVRSAWRRLPLPDDHEDGGPSRGARQLPIRPTVAFDVGCLGSSSDDCRRTARLADRGRRYPGHQTVRAGAQCTSKSLTSASLYYSPEQFAKTFAHLAAGGFDVAALPDRHGGPRRWRTLLNGCVPNPRDAKILLDPTR